MNQTHITQFVRAPRPVVYRALLDPAAVQKWRVPTGMTSEVHEFEPREGGRFRVSLTYEDPGERGKTTSRTDTYHGRFTELVPDERVVEVVEFETTDPAMQGEMTLTTTLRDVEGGTELVAVHQDLPAGLDAAANEQGWSISLAKLAELVEGDNGTGRT